MNTKQIILVRKDLKMRRGKECAQSAHASIAWLTERLVSIVTRYDGVKSNNVGDLIRSQFSDEEWAWMQGSFAKVVLQVSSEDELCQYFQQAKNAGLETHLITDSGKTEFNGIPTVTTVGIGPDSVEKINKITGKLKPY